MDRKNITFPLVVHLVYSFKHVLTFSTDGAFHLIINIFWLSVFLFYLN